MNNGFFSLIYDFIDLIYPNVCLACGNKLFRQEEFICTSCLFHLPKTNYHFEPDNPVTQLFWGRIPIYSATAYYHFSKGGKVQHLLHHLKYNGQKNLGIFIGRLMGYEIKTSGSFKDVNIIVPVPLHPGKKRKRGYNQSEQFAIGLSESMDVGIDTTSLIRKISSETQTKKTRFKRWENVEGAFTITGTDKLAGKHILLVDDVITTGSTLESCATTLNKISSVKISVAGIAFAIH